MNGTKVKICGLFRLADAAAVNTAMPDYAGFVFCEKSRRNVTPSLAGAIRAELYKTIVSVGVFVNAPLERIETLYRQGVIAVAQLHGTEDDAYLAVLRTRLPALEIWQAFRVTTAESLLAAAKSTADRVLLDGGAGQGKPFSWQLAKQFPRPYILAGGLTPENIPKAIRRLHPYAVDLSSGVETDGVKDAGKIAAAVHAARRTQI